MMLHHVSVAALPLVFTAALVVLRRRVRKQIDETARRHEDNAVNVPIRWAGLAGGERLNKAVFWLVGVPVAGLVGFSAFACVGWGRWTYATGATMGLLILYLLKLGTLGPHDLYLGEHGLFWRGFRSWLSVRRYEWGPGGRRDVLYLTLETSGRGQGGRVLQLPTRAVSPTHRDKIDRLLADHVP